MGKAILAVLVGLTLIIGCDSSSIDWESTDFSGTYNGDITISYTTENEGTVSETGTAIWTIDHKQESYTLDIEMAAEINITLNPRIDIIIPARIKDECKLTSVPGVGDFVCQIGAIAGIPHCAAGPKIVFESSPSYRIRFDESFPDAETCPVKNVSGTLSQ
ncbi:MAG: hypothetical protein OXL40_14175 [Bacteroidota bacterium]|nr:hypothetical protein [Bacteroidota bacterium]